MKKLRPSNDSQRINEDSWYYEYPRSIDVVVWITGRDGRNVVKTVRIPARKLMASAARCGWKAAKKSPATTPKKRSKKSSSGAERTA